MLAAMHGKIACVEKLLEAGANVWEISNLGALVLSLEWIYSLKNKFKKNFRC